MLITDQVATAPCNDPIQERFRTFEASDVRGPDLGTSRKLGSSAARQ